MRRDPNLWDVPVLNFIQIASVLAARLNLLNLWFILSSFVHCIPAQGRFQFILRKNCFDLCILKTLRAHCAALSTSPFFKQPVRSRVWKLSVGKSSMPPVLSSLLLVAFLEERARNLFTGRRVSKLANDTPFSVPDGTLLRKA